MKSDSESEFEDAVDSLPFSPAQSTRYPAQLKGDRIVDGDPFVQPHMFYTGVGSDKFSASPAVQDSVRHRELFNTPSTSSSIQSDFAIPSISTSLRNATRRGRLEILRNRMKSEFGPPSVGSVASSSGAFSLDDNNSQRSDCTSLASWGHNLLMEQSQNLGGSLAVVVHPSDSLSTRATPAPQLFDNAFVGEQFCPDADKDRIQASFQGLGHDDGRRAKNAEELYPSTKADFLNEEIYASNRPHSSANHLTKSPPIHPPPPLPRYLLQQQPSTSSAASDFSDGCRDLLCGPKSSSSLPPPPMSPPIPPPLPPRRSSAVLPPKLPPIAVNISGGDGDDLETKRLFQPVAEALPSTSGLPQMQGEVPIIGNGNGGCVNIHESKSDRVSGDDLSSSTSSSSVEREDTFASSFNDGVHSVNGDMASVKHSAPSFLANFGVKRGHVKTNSLDRGLSLAKSMKSGPFPPPASSKSNSLNRDASPCDVRTVLATATCEEDQRITSAHGVIQQLTSCVLSSSATDTSGQSLGGGTAAKQLNNSGGADSTSQELTKKSFTGEIVERIRIKYNSRKRDRADETVASTKYPSHLATTNLTAVGEEVASIVSSASTIPPPANQQNLSNPHYENLDLAQNVVEVTFSTKPLKQSERLAVVSGTDNCNGDSSVTVNNAKSSPNLAVTLTEYGVDVAEKSSIEILAKSQSLPRETSSMRASHSRSESSKTVSRMESIDPVTRDVQRRMSLSSISSFQKNNSSNDSTSRALSGGISQMKNVALSYGTAASGFLRGAVQRAKTVVSSNKQPRNLSQKIGNGGGGDDTSDSDEDEGNASISDALPPKMSLQNTVVAEPPVICRPKNTKKGPFDFDQLRLAQDLSNEHTGAVWCVKFSVCGRLFATGGQDNIVRVWVLKSHLNYFTKMRERYSHNASSSSAAGQQQQSGGAGAMQDIENLRMQEDFRSDATGCDSANTPISDVGFTDFACSSAASSAGGGAECAGSGSTASESSGDASSILVVPKPFCIFRGHTADVLDLSWSPKNYFILSSGIDRTVKLWHLTRNECLCCFQHMDFVTCIAFMPKDDRYFISGSLDGKIRLWHIPEKKVALWNEVEQAKFITAITFVRNGKFVVVGTYNGRCFFYSTDQLKYHTVIDVRSTRGKNARGHKITSLAVHGDKLLITSNDSRIRMYDLRDMDLTCKFKGAQIEQSQIRASFSPDGRHIISGSEDNYIYIWRTSDLPASISVRKDRNPMWERVRAHNSVVTAAVFAPKPNLFLAPLLLAARNREYATASAAANTPSSSSGGGGVLGSVGSSGSGAALAMKTVRSMSLSSATPAAGLESFRIGRNRLMELSRIGRNHSPSALPVANFTSSLISSSISSSSKNSAKQSMIGATTASTSGIGVHSSAFSMASSGSGPSDLRRHSKPATSSNAGVSSSSTRLKDTINGGGEPLGDVIVSADINGSLKIFLNPARLRAGASSFFSTNF